MEMLNYNTVISNFFFNYECYGWTVRMSNEAPIKNHDLTHHR
jgi:hypothetical protein